MFDDLPEYFGPTGEEHRGYKLSLQSVATNVGLEEVAELEAYDGAVVYRCDPVDQFSPFTAKASLLHDEPVLLGSSQFAAAAKLKEGEKVAFEIDGVPFERVFKIDTEMKGTIALNPSYDMGLSASLLSSYRFSRPVFKKINNENIGNNDE